jgi:hypothetical protein
MALSRKEHRVLLDALDDPAAMQQIEFWAFEFFRGTMSPAKAFERFREIAPSPYDLIAYLFFLMDSNHYTPIKPRKFDEAFKKLGIDPVTSRRCSWDNYERFNSALQEIRGELAEITGITNLSLIDSHSFCYLYLQVRRRAAGHGDQEGEGAVDGEG